MIPGAKDIAKCLAENAAANSGGILAGARTLHA